jgi:YidC/Oxa1 family membrane protein insertase
VGFTGWKYLDQPFNPNHLDTGTEFFRSLSGRAKMPFLGIDLSISPAEALSLGVATAIPFFILMALMLAGQVYQNRQIQGRNPNANVNPQQQAIMKFLPFILPVFSFGFPAGLSLYYFTQGLCRIATQHYITHKYYGDGGPAVVEAKSRPAGKDSATPADKGVGKGAGKGAGKGNDGAAKPAARKPGTSAKSQAVQRKQGSGAPSSTRRASGGRRSGEPRRGASGSR